MSTAVISGGSFSVHNKRRNRSRLRIHAPTSIQVVPPPSSLVMWNVAIPLLSPIDIVSLSSIVDLWPPDLSSEEGESPAADDYADREWLHPVEPLFYEPLPANSPALAVSQRSRGLPSHLS
ncbi:hypothetical protein KSP40_PGU011860 [Platanthera guangdongensis]|uniref:Uncharacterized protein n=1 Tax=Platanthera guangdongensis TaxID=2320717 RepID=A0ABR2LGK5_9ASPA